MINMIRSAWFFILYLFESREQAKPAQGLSLPEGSQHKPLEARGTEELTVRASQSFFCSLH